MPKLPPQCEDIELDGSNAADTSDAGAVITEWYGWSTIKPIVDNRIWPLCSTPYQGHRKGCKNYCTHVGCPPDLTPLKLRLDKPFWAVWIKFDLESHIAKMKQRHPDWGIYMLVNPLYWQTSSKKFLRDIAKKFSSLHPELLVLARNSRTDSYFNVTETMKQVGQSLEWPARKYSYEILFAGSPVSKCTDAEWRELQSKWPEVYRVREQERSVTTQGLVDLQFGKLLVKSFTPGVGWLVECKQCGNLTVFKNRSALIRSTTCGCTPETKAKPSCRECNSGDCRWCVSLK
jgi:hypothetical protein